MSLCLEILFISHSESVAGSLFIDMKESQVWRAICDRGHTTVTASRIEFTLVLDYY